MAFSRALLLVESANTKVKRDGLVSIVFYSRPSSLTFVSASQFYVYLLWVHTCLAQCLKCESAISY